MILHTKEEKKGRERKKSKHGILVNFNIEERMKNKEEKITFNFHERFFFLNLSFFFEKMGNLY